MDVQPVDEISDHDVAPHPGGKAFEPAERIVGGSVTAQPANIAVDPVRVGPVRLGGDGTEALLLDEPLRDRRPRLVELLRAMRTLADQDDPRVSDDLLKRLSGGTPAGASTAARSITSAGVSLIRIVAVAGPTVGVAR